MVMERLDAASRLPENQDPTKQFAIKQAKRLLHAAKVKDPGPKDQVQETSPKQDEGLVGQRSEAWETLRKQELELPPEVKSVLERAKARGINSLEAYFLSEITLEEGVDYPGWNVKPASWYWEHIRDGKLDSDAPELKGVWVLIDLTRKPDCTEDGKQVYDNDPFGNILAQLRRDKKIEVPSTYGHVPQNSRFAISWDELNQHVLPAIAETLGVKPEQVRLPRAIEFNVIGNLFHPEWGRTNTCEWFEDNFGYQSRLNGGMSELGGLSDADYDWSVYRFDSTGFRPLVVFSSKA